MADLPRYYSPIKAVVNACKSTTPNRYAVHVSFLSSSEYSQSPVDINIVIDRATSGARFRRFLSSVQKIVNILSENDRLSIISFAGTARVELQSCKMDETGKQKANAVLKDIHCDPSAKSNLWNGLEASFAELTRMQGEDRDLEIAHRGNCALFLFTNGAPSDFPGQPHQEMLRELKKNSIDSEKRFPIVNTFGFDHDPLNSEFLVNLAAAGDGQYFYISDQNMLELTITHAMAVLYTTFAIRVRVEVSPANGAEFAEDHLQPGYTINRLGEEAVLQAEVGSIHYGQSRDIVFPMLIPADSTKPYAKIRILYQIPHCLNVLSQYLEGTVKTPECTDEILSHRFRLQTAQLIHDIATSLTRRNEDLDICLNREVDRVRSHIETMNDRAVGMLQGQGRESPRYRIMQLIQDVQGEVIRALATQTWEKWGKHYLYSLSRAHLLQICNNSKDYGLTCYLSPEAQNIIGEHCPLYDGKNNFCFSGNSIVYMADGSTKRVDNLRIGDIVLVDRGTGACAKIRCIVKNTIFGTALIVKINKDLYITPFHPVLINGKWRFPAEVSTPTYRACDAVYSIVLESVFETANHDSTVVVGGIQCATLGHGLKGEVIEHAYFGTRLVLNDLEKMNGWSQGLVIVKETVRGIDGRVCGLIASEGESSALHHDTMATIPFF